MFLRSLIASALVLATCAQPPQSPNQSPGVPDNDRCINREILKPYIPVEGDNTGANFDYNNQGVCGSRSDRPAIWYEVRGRGAQVTVKVCTNNEVITDFGVITECNTRKCQGAPPQTFEAANCDLGESVDYSWFAEDDIQYFVHVRADVLNGVGSNFTIVYEDESLDGPLSEAPTFAPGSRESNALDDDGANTLSFVVITIATLITVLLQ